MTIIRWQDHLRRIDPLDDRTIRWDDILRITGLTKSQVKLKIDSDEFPAPFLITDSGRSLGWHASEVSAWIAARDAHREATRGLPRGVMPNKQKKPAKKAVRR
jgi:predicted DNA-binding transcriptional regulator AlpA